VIGRARTNGVAAILPQPFRHLFCNPYHSEYNIVTKKVAEKLKKISFYRDFFATFPFEYKYFVRLSVYSDIIRGWFSIFFSGDDVAKDIGVIPHSGFTSKMHVVPLKNSPWLRAQK
jgi:hypothetical protein